MIEDFLYALKTFRMNKTRTILSLLGVVIGVASVIVITTIGESATKNIQNSFGSSALDMVQVRSGFMRRNRSSTLQFDETFRQDLWDNVKNIKQIFYMNSISATLRLGDTDVTATCQAVETDYLQANNLELESGRLFTVSENVYGAQKVILGSEVAESFFPDGKAVGKMITIDASKILFGFEVIGVLKSHSSGMESTNNNAYITRGFYSKKIKPNPAAQSIVVQCTSQDYATQVAEDIETYVEKKTGIEKAVNVMSMASMLEQFDTITGTLSLLLSGVAAISLLVGGIGIMNIMIVSVTERKKEIGIRKALGATPSAIKTQFLVESATITLAGGLLGILLGFIISVIATVVMKWSFAIQWSAVLISFLFSAFIGIFFGYNPASRASKLDPVEALSSE
jgi:putative ABC transport system permease protein